MRLQLILPRVEPTVITLPLVCPHDNCEGTHFQHHQEVCKAVRDTVYDQVRVHRYKCLRCGRTFRVYPKGVSHAQASQRVTGLAVRSSRGMTGRAGAMTFTRNIWTPAERCSGRKVASSYASCRKISGTQKCAPTEKAARS